MRCCVSGSRKCCLWTFCSRLLSACTALPLYWHVRTSLPLHLAYLTRQLHLHLHLYF